MIIVDSDYLIGYNSVRIACVVEHSPAGGLHAGVTVMDTCGVNPAVTLPHSSL